MPVNPLNLCELVPTMGLKKRWEQDWKDRYNAILDKSDHVVYVCQHYSKSCFQIRNEWMVNHSARVIAVFNGEKSGTKNTIDYASKRKLEIRYIKG